jgi:hypothetical protein
MAGGNKESGIRVAAEVMAKDLEGADGIAKGAHCLAGGQALDKEGAECFVDTLLGGARLEEEAAAFAGLAVAPRFLWECLNSQIVNSFL